MQSRDGTPPSDGRWDGQERRAKPRRWGRGAAAAFDRMRMLERQNPQVDDPEPPLELPREQHKERE
ncbi:MULTISPECIES: hypothetical protein [Ramlibacter]|uniref:Uncharacterized protein n=1 Tax=Ramlibacter pinisoli TaxID=2682844 RepID=A0A6N8ITG1_9BURK|nr:MULTISPECIES: hypothetical protein [Ramlibacter]MBA2964217.1 hypothetical protein [Ramlibacter sp. CGMCC 1.13660]MVQ29183.1 hypothetical protein [Ramlibacter pinisoli]